MASVFLVSSTSAPRSVPGRGVMVSNRSGAVLSLAQKILFWYTLARLSLKAYRHLRATGVIPTVRSLYNSVLLRLFKLYLKFSPSTRSNIAKEIAKARLDMQDKVAPEHAGEIDRITALPAQAKDIKWIEEELGRREVLGDDWREGRLSGAVYLGQPDEHPVNEAIKLAVNKFMLSNPLHPDVFQGVRRMDAELVKMVLHMFNAPASGCGTTTSGGTESILLACLAYRNWARETKGVTEPELVVPSSAHAAFEKAAAYFNITLRSVPVDPVTRQADLKATRRAINRNTIALVGSAPNFPDGIIDNIPELAKLAQKHKIGLHVDCCLGSFLVPFMARAGFDIEPFDFAVPGVTSISCDPHKYGFTCKGISTVLYRDPELRRHQFFVSTTWSGGVYASPTFAGSRPGSLIAGAWASLVSMGEEGYIDSCKQIVSAARKLIHQLGEEVPEVRILGDPKVSVVAFTSDVVDILEVGDRLSKKGWHLNALQHPSALHICVTRLTIPHIEELVSDVKAAVRDVLLDPASTKGTMTTIYGLGSTAVVGPGLVSQMASIFTETLYHV